MDTLVGLVKGEQCVVSVPNQSCVWFIPCLRPDLGLFSPMNPVRPTESSNNRRSALSVHTACLLTLQQHIKARHRDRDVTHVVFTNERWVLVLLPMSTRVVNTISDRYRSGKGRQGSPTLADLLTEAELRTPRMNTHKKMSSFKAAMAE